MDRQNGINRTFFFSAKEWSTTKRVLVTLVGAGFAISAFRSKGSVKGALGIAGLVAATRGLLDLDLTTLVGRMTHPITSVHRRIRVRAPVQVVYEFWKNTANYSRFMSNVVDVRTLGDGLQEWTIGAKGRPPLHWKSVAGPTLEKQVVGWRSLPGAPLTHSCQVAMIENDNDTTTLAIDLTFGPPMGAMGSAIVRVFGPDVLKHVGSDLRKMKVLVESHGQETESPKTRVASG